MLKHHENNFPVCAPAPDWVLIVQRQLTANGKVFPCGSVIGVSDLGRNYSQLLSSHFIAWCPPSGAVRPQPRALPPAPVVKPRPPIWLSDNPDPVAAWQESVARRTADLGGDRTLAKDQLMADHNGAQQYKRAQYEACKREARRRNVPSVSPDQCAELR